MLPNLYINYEINESHQKEMELEIEHAFSQGRKNSLVDPVVASYMDPKLDGRTASEKPDQDFITKCAKIGAFLMDKEAVINQLIKLNTLIKEINKKELKIKDFRLLLERELHKIGFYPQFGKTFGNIRPDGFRATLAHKLLLKDAILGDQDHGEFTHIIQWLVIGWQQENTNFLNIRAVEIFKHLGHEKSVYNRDPIYPKQNQNTARAELSIWDIVVDRFGTDDFRSPSTFQKFMLENDRSELACLKGLLTNRKKKRITPYAVEKLIAKHKYPTGIYHQGDIQFVHEPEGMKIDLTSFRKNGF